MLILGLSGLKHDPSACLLEDGIVRAAIENDKLRRQSTKGLPFEAIQFCLNSRKITWKDLDAIAIATRPSYGFLRGCMLRAKLYPSAPIASVYYAISEVQSLARGLNALRVLKTHATGKVLSFDHHECHAGSAFFQSPFERALIVTLDENGDGISASVALGEGNRVQRLGRIAFPHSLGWIYSQITGIIGFCPRQDDHKTQWLSLEGEPEFENVFLEMLRIPGSPFPHLNRSFFNAGLARTLAFSQKFYESINAASGTGRLIGDQRRALASSVQHACTKIVVDLVSHFAHKKAVDAICLAGGLFQNSLLVSDLEKAGIGRVFVPPAPGNAGTAVGAALLYWNSVGQQPRRQATPYPYWGPNFSRQHVKDVLDNCKTRYLIQNTERRKLEVSLELLLSGKIIGWYQGAAEFGSRALGNRSILASPWAPYAKENLNDFIKHREWFRPFALAIPEEDAGRYFEASLACKLMNSLARVKTDCTDVPPIFLLPGRRVRLQIVECRSNPIFWEMLKLFGEHAPAPILLNTSFNLFGEPLVVTPRDAVRSYFCSGIDALVIENFVLSKATMVHVLATAPQFHRSTTIG